MANRPGLTVLLLGLVLLILRPIGSEQHVPSGESITASDLRRDVSFLASDEMRGRLVGTPENDSAAKYIEQRFERFGAKPIGRGLSYRQPFQLMTTTLVGINTLRIDTGHNEESIEVLREFFPEPFSGTGSAIGPIVFIGFGISAAALLHDDYRDANLSGKIALVLEHEPGEFDPDSPFAGVVTSEYRRSIRKALEAQQRGAIAIIFIEDVHNHVPRPDLSDLSRRIWPRNQTRVPQYQLASWVNQLHIPAIRISSDQAERLIRNTGQSLHTLARRAEVTGGAAPLEIPGTTIEIVASVRRETISVDNVVGLIEGADPVLKDEWLILCGHYDHDGATPTRIFNGADDDASGIAALLEIAEAYSRASHDGYRPKRSILLAAWNAEEQGLLGAWAYTENPIAPLSNTIAVVNMDMIGRSEEVPPGGGYRFQGLPIQTAESNRNAVNILGYSYSHDLQVATEAANHITNLVLRFRYDNNGSNLLRRSDHWPFLFSGVPAIFVHTGLHPDYHTERDRPDTLDYDKMARIVKLVYRLSWDLARGDTRPALN